MRLILITLLAWTTLMPYPAGAASSSSGEGNLSSMGPFPAGVTTVVLVDSNRTDAFTKNARTLVTEIWYPSADEARNSPKNKFSDFIPGGANPEIEAAVQSSYKMSIAEVDKMFSNESVRNAPVREGKFPLIVFSHGNGGNRHQNTFWCDFLASHGYIIVSADHVGNASMTILDGKPITYQNSQRAASAIDRPKDMMFLLDQMTLWNQGADKRFAGKMLLDKVCASGMSFGAMTAESLVAMDSRFKSMIAMSGASLGRTNLTVPSLWMLGQEDRTIGSMGNLLIRSHHSIHTGPSFLLELKEGGHYSFTDMFKINKTFGDGVGPGKRRESGEAFEYTSMAKTYEIVNSYSLAFLDVYAKGKKERLAFLRENHWPNEVVLKVSGAEDGKL
jgi:dienelactone hydrolase